MKGTLIRGWLDGAPSEWKIDRLKDCFSLVVGGDWGDDPDSDAEGQDLVVLRVADFSNGSVTKDNLTIRRIKGSKIPQRLVKESSLLVEKSGGGDNQWVGRVVHPGSLSFEAICSNFIAKLDAFPRHQPEFLNYLFSALYDSNVNRPHVRQTTGIQNLALHHYLGVNVALPVSAEQKRITAYLDASCAAIDMALGTKQQQLETLDALRKSVIQKAVTQGLNPDVEMKDSGVSWFGGIPGHWLCESLKRSTSRIQTGTTPPTSSPEYFENGTIHWFAPESFGRTTKLGEPKKLIHESAVEDNKLRVFAPDTVLFVGIGATIGKVAVLEDEGSANQQIVGITCDHRMKGRFLAYQLKNYEAIIPRIAQYTTLPILNQTKVGYLTVLRPPISEQQAICDYLEAKEVELDAVEKVLQTQIETLTAYRKSLIHECVTGRRRITDADVAHVQAHV